MSERDDNGEEVTHVRLRTRTELVGHFDGMPKARVLIESCTLARWISRDLTQLGHEVCVAAPNFLPMSVDHASKRKKTDKRDASLLSLALQKGDWRPAHQRRDPRRSGSV